MEITNRKDVSCSSKDWYQGHLWTDCVRMQTPSQKGNVHAKWHIFMPQINAMQHWVIPYPYMHVVALFCLCPGKNAYTLHTKRIYREGITRVPNPNHAPITLLQKHSCPKEIQYWLKSSQTRLHAEVFREHTELLKFKYTALYSGQSLKKKQLHKIFAVCLFPHPPWDFSVLLCICVH